MHLKQHDIGILIPTDPSFSYVDFIIVDAKNEHRGKIYLLKTAININEHVKSDIWYINEMRSLFNNLKTKTEVISNIIYQIICEKADVEVKFIWVGGDDLILKQDVKARELLINKHEDSGIALMNYNTIISQFIE